MEYGKKDWQRSEGRMRIEGRNDLRTDKKLHAYHPAEREDTWEKRPNEMLQMESSYGGISFGANRRRKMTMVFHEKRQHNGPTLEKDEQEVDGNRTASLSELRGDFRTNSHDRVKSAMVYREKVEETPGKMMARIQEMMDENHQKSGEKMLPFMNRKEDRDTREQIESGLRTSIEKRDMQEYARWNRIREKFRREQAEKREMRRRFYQSLQFAREKSRRLMREEGTEKLTALWSALNEELAATGDVDGQEPADRPEEAQNTASGAENERNGNGKRIQRRSKK